ncbi:hypothetical protein BC826DRAFT_994742 [Russula brevipes]|nr:hypothetical protein BC826DRAFT_994742 [Russula brevipes]
MHLLVVRPLASFFFPCASPLPLSVFPFVSTYSIQVSTNAHSFPLSSRRLSHILTHPLRYNIYQSSMPSFLPAFSPCCSFTRRSVYPC